MPLLLLLLACKPSTETELGAFIVRAVDGGLVITHRDHGVLLDDLRIDAGSGSAEVTMQFGAFRFSEVRSELTAQHELTELPRDGGDFAVDLLDTKGRPLGELAVSLADDDRLELTFTSRADGPPAEGRVRLSAACGADEHFLGLGSHAMDVDHVGQAFPLWVSEPGIGKALDEEEPPDFPLGGTRHASSYPVPWLLRPHVPHGLLVDTFARVEVDLCATSDRFSLDVWERDTRFHLITGDGPLAVVENLSDVTGRPELAPAWAFAPWNDAIRGPERVREVAATLREAGAPSSVIWTEDWKGANETATGYRLGEEWLLDRELYPDAEALDAALEALGFKWFSYFAPFVAFGSQTGDDAERSGVLIQDSSGAPYRFFGVTFEEVTLIDLSTDAGREWAKGYLQGSLDLGFDGWMVDYAEWLPTDAALASGESGLLAHNRYPSWWQQANAEVFAGTDATYFCRSGWAGAAATCPIVWVGDQRTSFDADDGYPTVLPLVLGLSASGVPIATHDVAGYQSVGNAPSTQELWFRWASLGAFTPVLRTHHGAFDTDNHQFDTNPETLDHWVGMATEHMRLWPYRYGLAAKAAKSGTPMVLPTGFLFPGEDWGRMDAWMLGESLLVAPVLEAGATSRQVDLPRGEWFDWWTGAPAQSGVVASPVTHIPVFAASGTTVPTFGTVPDTLVAGAVGLVTLAEADRERVVHLFGDGGRFVEADGTTYAPRGKGSGPATATATLRTGSVDVGGLTVAIDGPVERAYTLVVH
ncbi:MAG: alpha-glucosidase [Myxococcota bacterium]|jgi:alpha-glucosidase